VARGIIFARPGTTVARLEDPITDSLRRYNRPAESRCRRVPGTVSPRERERTPGGSSQGPETDPDR